MDIKRLTTFDWMAAGGAVLAIVSLWLPWYGVSFGGETERASAWESLDGIDVLILLLSLAVIVVVGLRLVSSIKLPSALVIMGIGIAIALLVLFRIIDKPWDSDAVDGGGFLEIDAGVSWGIFFSLLFGIAIAVAGFLKLGEHPAPAYGGAAGLAAPQYSGQQLPPPTQYPGQTYPAPAYPGQVQYQGQPAYGAQPAVADPGTYAPQAQPYQAPAAQPQPDYAQPYAAVPPAQLDHGQQYPVTTVAAAPAEPSAVVAPDQAVAPAAAPEAAAAAPVAAGPPAGSAFCGNCGTPMAPDAAFCTNCGTKRA